MPHEEGAIPADGALIFIEVEKHWPAEAYEGKAKDINEAVASIKKQVLEKCNGVDDSIVFLKDILPKTSGESLKAIAIDIIASKVIDRIKTRGSSNPGFDLEFSDDMLKSIIRRGKELNLSDKAIDDLVFVASRKAKRISFEELLNQMDTYANVVRERGFPYLFGSKEEFEEYKSKLKAILERHGIKGEVIIQGSSLRKAGAADIDIDIRVTGEELERIVKAKFGNANPGSAKEKTMIHALESGKIKLSQAGHKQARNEIAELGVEFDISFVSKDGAFALEPSMGIIEII